MECTLPVGISRDPMWSLQDVWGSGPSLDVPIVVLIVVLRMSFQNSGPSLHVWGSGPSSDVPLVVLMRTPALTAFGSHLMGYGLLLVPMVGLRRTPALTAFPRHLMGYGLLVVSIVGLRRTAALTAFAPYPHYVLPLPIPVQMYLVE